GETGRRKPAPSRTSPISCSSAILFQRDLVSRGRGLPLPPGRAPLTRRSRGGARVVEERAPRSQPEKPREEEQPVEKHDQDGRSRPAAGQPGRVSHAEPRQARRRPSPAPGRRSSGTRTPSPFRP